MAKLYWDIRELRREKDLERERLQTEKDAAVEAALNRADTLLREKDSAVEAAIRSADTLYALHREKEDAVKRADTIQREKEALQEKLKEAERRPTTPVRRGEQAGTGRREAIRYQTFSLSAEGARLSHMTPDKVGRVASALYQSPLHVQLLGVEQPPAFLMQTPEAQWQDVLQQQEAVQAELTRLLSHRNSEGAHIHWGELTAQPNQDIDLRLNRPVQSHAADRNPPATSGMERQSLGMERQTSGMERHSSSTEPKLPFPGRATSAPSLCTDDAAPEVQTRAMTLPSSVDHVTLQQWPSTPIGVLLPTAGLPSQDLETDRSAEGMTVLFETILPQ